MDKALREQAFTRQDGYCCWCGLPLPEVYAMHHRKLRSRGGKDELSNLVALHHGCHNLATDSVHLNPAKATARGFMISSGNDPRVVPLVMIDGTMLYLDGTEPGTKGG